VKYGADVLLSLSQRGNWRRRAEGKRWQTISLKPFSDVFFFFFSQLIIFYG
jgi:hypothetical protein